MTRIEQTPRPNVRHVNDVRSFLVPDHMAFRPFFGVIAPRLRQFRVTSPEDDQSRNTEYAFDVMRLRRVVADCRAGRAAWRNVGEKVLGHLQAYIEHTVPQESLRYPDPTGMLDVLYNDDGTAYQAVTLDSCRRQYADRDHIYRTKTTRNLASVLTYGAEVLPAEVRDSTVALEGLEYEDPHVFTPEGFATLSAHVVMYGPELPIDVRPNTVKELFSYGAAIRTLLAKSADNQP